MKIKLDMIDFDWRESSTGNQTKICILLTNPEHVEYSLMPEMTTYTEQTNKEYQISESELG